jgi:hypothetical protein
MLVVDGFERHLAVRVLLQYRMMMPADSERAHSVKADAAATLFMALKVRAEMLPETPEREHSQDASYRQLELAKIATSARVDLVPETAAGVE